MMRNFAQIWSRIKFSIISTVCLQCVIGVGTHLSLGFYYAYNVVAWMTLLLYVWTHIHTHTRTEGWLHYRTAPNFWDSKKSSEAPKSNQAALQLKAITPLQLTQKPDQVWQLYLHNRIKRHYFVSLFLNCPIGKSHACYATLQYKHASVYVYMHVAWSDFVERELGTYICGQAATVHPSFETLWTANHSKSKLEKPKARHVENLITAKLGYNTGRRALRT